MLFDALPGTEQQRTLEALAALQGQREPSELLDGSLVRQLDRELFDPDQVPMNVATRSDGDLELDVRNMDLPTPVPESWQVTPLDERRSRVRVPAGAELFMAAGQRSRVHSARRLPEGFRPG